MAVTSNNRRNTFRLVSLFAIVGATTMGLMVDWPQAMSRLNRKRIGPALKSPSNVTEETGTNSTTSVAVPAMSSAIYDVRQLCLDQTQDTQTVAKVPVIDQPSFTTSEPARPEITHWSFIKPRPQSAPHVRDRTWPANPIDEFILHRLETEDLTPSIRADRSRLIRRVALDLIGLPPSPDEVDEFLADVRPDHYERLTDRLLASPHFGEKWATRWLDLARYADSNGYEFDAVRTMWLYRDWVIDSLNRDLPFDRFTVEQLAGDLIPGAGLSQQVATGFVRCSTVAPDTQNHRFDMLIDRVNTLGTTWLGLSFACAQCHDHTFDPVTQKEFYQLFAIFNNSVDEVEGLHYEAPVVEALSPINGMAGKTLVLAERSQPNESFLKIRGSPSTNGERVEPGLPAFLNRPRCGSHDRLSLACWLVDENNPLTSRVAANRVWETVFGTGLVRTSEDFGKRGEPPSHPELLDWLALEFQRLGWSNKRLLSRIITSETYCQSADCLSELRTRDPQNRLLARGPRFRVDAELVRDISLAASGLLSENLGGPNVYPWQPEGTSEKLEFAGFSWKVNTDENRYRRGIYTHWKRTALYPSFAMFDAPNRSVCCARRVLSTTPLQALATLNDPVYFEAAVQLGRRMLDQSRGDPASAVKMGFRLCVSRPPSADELSLLLHFWNEEVERVRNDPEAANSTIGDERLLAADAELNISEWAAYTTLANVLLNLDETITKE